MYTPAWHFVTSCLGDATTKEGVIPFMRHLTVWGVEPAGATAVVTDQTSWLESTCVCGVRQKQAGGSSVRKRAYHPVVGSLGQITKSADH